MIKYKPQHNRIKRRLRKFEKEKECRVLYACPQGVHQFGIGSDQDRVRALVVYIYGEEKYSQNDIDIHPTTWLQEPEYENLPRLRFRTTELRNLLRIIGDGDSIFLKDLLYGKQYQMRTYSMEPIFRAVLAKTQVAFSPYDYYNNLMDYGENAWEEIEEDDTAFRRYLWSIVSRAVMYNANWSIPVYDLRTISKEFLKEVCKDVGARGGKIYEYIQSLPRKDGPPQGMKNMLEKLSASLPDTTTFPANNDITKDEMNDLFQKVQAVTKVDAQKVAT